MDTLVVYIYYQNTVEYNVSQYKTIIKVTIMSVEDIFILLFSQYVTQFVQFKS